MIGVLQYNTKLSHVMTTSPFQQLQQIAESDGLESAINYLEQYTRRQKQFAQLFEVLKMRVRQRMGLPILYSDVPDDLEEPQQRELEDGLLSACREVGTLLFRNGDFAQGWIYLQPVGDHELNEKLLKSVPINEENSDAIIDIALSQGAAPVYGFQMLLEHFGTCNAITTFDTQAGRYDVTTQRLMAAELLDSLYQQVVEGLTEVVREAGGEMSDGNSLVDLFEKNPQLAEGTYVVDASHLASVVRISRMLQSPDEVLKAYQLSQYGSYLPKDFQYAGQPPFEDTYRDHLHYYGAILGKDVDVSVEHFRKKAGQSDAAQHGPVAIETLIELLVRVGRGDEALAVMTEQLLGQHAPLGIAPAPAKMVETESQKTKLMEFYQSQDDLLGFAQCLLGE
jgi:hypothetical protein